MSELSIEEIEQQQDEDFIFEEMHYHNTLYSVRELCLKHGTDTIMNEIKEYLALQQE